MTGAIGYVPVGGGGISNQKMALLGLFLTALERRVPMALPDICNMDQVNRRYEAVPFASVFDGGAMAACAARHGVALVPAEAAALARGYDDHFWKAHRIFETVLFADRENPVHDAALDLLRSLRARIGGSYLARQLRADIFGACGVAVVAQLRVEADWVRHCTDNLLRVHTAPEDMLLPFDAIVAKVMRTWPATRAIYAVCDEPALPVPKTVMRDLCRDRWGVHLLFKSDFLSAFEAQLLAPLHLALLDFEIALAAPRFVGLTRSTFSNLVTLEKAARTGRPVTDHHVYNKPGPLLAQRTDNGCHWDPLAATAAAA